MNREQLEHILRAASAIAHEPDVLVIGSQSVLGSFAEDDLPQEATSSMEAARQLQQVQPGLDRRSASR